MNLKRTVWVLGFCCALGAPAPLLWAAPDGRPTASLRSLDLEDIKVQWFSRGEEELPAWISAHFDVGPLGQVTGRVTETELAADGVDEDGDPYGFETSVFDTSDGSLRDPVLQENVFTFTMVYPEDGGRVAYALVRSRAVQGQWDLNAASRGPKGASAGHNRFPLAGEEKKAGALKIFTDPADFDDKGLQSL